MYKLYFHNGSGNHGCEAIVRSTVKILNAEKDKLELYSGACEEDKKYCLDDICRIKEDTNIPMRKYSFNYFFSYIISKLKKSEYRYVKYAHKNFFDNISKNDICFSIGGDNYCYTGLDKLAFYNKAIKEKKAKTVLWGCSVEPEVITDNVKNDLAAYDLITARESLSYEALKKVNNNTYLFPDPAFQLDYVLKELPDGFDENNTVGINVSPLIVQCESNDGITMKNYISLMKYIIDETDMRIALIPHVVKDKNDDMEVLEVLYNLFKDTNRVILLNNDNCMVLKGYIKRCRFIVTARTHASIAAYSTCVPTLVVGYSVKAKGIAKDIFGTHSNYVIPVQNLSEESSLTNSFKWLITNENKIRKHLVEFMPDYCAKALKAKEKIDDLSK